MLTTPNASEDVAQQELLFIDGRKVKCYSHFGRQFGSFYKPKPYRMIQQLCSLVVTPMSLKHIHIKICIWMFTEALFINAKT